MSAEVVLCMHSTTILCQFGLFVTSLPTCISINSQPFPVGIVSQNAQAHDMCMDPEHYRFRAIIGHQDPLLASDPDWKGSKHNVQVEWET